MNNLLMTFNPKAKEKSKLPDFVRNAQFDNPETYEFSQELINAVNVAVYLGQPLLVTGEPGTGKTQLANAIAHFYGLEKPLVFNTKTTSTAKDLLYSYDSLAHFQYVQTNNEPLLPKDIEQKFIRYQALGEALRRNDKRYVVLFDEIDKAPRDLPNDILDVLEKMEFEVAELTEYDNNGNKKVKKIAAQEKFRPIVIMTSNSEKNLPDAFLRRCVFFHIKFPEEQLKTILKLKILGKDYSNEEWNALVEHFLDIRKKLKRKKPATSELILWTKILHEANFNFLNLKDINNTSTEEKNILRMSYSVLAKNRDDLELLTI